MRNSDLSRRDILKSAAMLAGSTLAPGVFATATGDLTSKQSSPNEKIVCGLIGCGGMGSANMRNLMAFDDFEMAAICDVDDDRMTGDFQTIEKKYGKEPAVYKDYRKMLERKDIDCVIIGTPDHWHAINLIHACQAGKDIYCEKPISHNILEANAMVDAKHKYKRVVQVGTWQRSNQEFIDAIAFVRGGGIGKLLVCRSWIEDTSRLGRNKPTAVPSNLDYDMWIGPAEMVPYQPNKVHYSWRWVQNTGGGKTTDWGVHMLDIALLGASESQDLILPTSVTASGGLWALTDDDRDVADTTEAVMTFNDPDMVMTWSVLRDHPGKPGHGTEFIGDSGNSVRVWRGGWLVLDKDGKELPKTSVEGYKTNHWRDFLDCMKSRGKPRADLDSVAQTTTCCHLINAALLSGEKVRYDKDSRDIVGRSGKSTLAYTRDYRSGYELPQV